MRPLMNFAHFKLLTVEFLFRFFSVVESSWIILKSQWILVKESKVKREFLDNHFARWRAAKNSDESLWCWWSWASRWSFVAPFFRLRLNFTSCFLLSRIWSIVLHANDFLNIFIAFKCRFAYICTLCSFLWHLIFFLFLCKFIILLKVI